MTNIEIKILTPEEIRTIEQNAHTLRSEALVNWLRVAAHWLAHPGFGHRNA